MLLAILKSPPQRSKIAPQFQQLLQSPSEGRNRPRRKTMV